MKLNDVRRFSAYVSTIYHSEYITKGLNFIPTPVREHPSHILQDYLLFD